MPAQIVLRVSSFASGGIVSSQLKVYGGKPPLGLLDASPLQTPHVALTVSNAGTTGDGSLILTLPESCIGLNLMAKQVTDDSFELDVLQAAGPVLVDFWAEWCGPCKQIAPSLDEISEELDGKMSLAKINIDENPETPSKYGVRGIPTLMLFKGGEVTSTKVGALPKSKLKEWVESVI